MGSKRYEKKINNPPEPPKTLFKPEPSRVDANPPRLGEDKMFKNSYREKTPASKELREKLRELAENNIKGEDNVETYYVVEVNGRYYENETVLYSDNEIFEHSVRTTKSLLECKRFYSKADAQETADKHGFVVRKVIVKVEE